MADFDKEYLEPYKDHIFPIVKRSIPRLDEHWILDFIYNEDLNVMELEIHFKVRQLSAKNLDMCLHAFHVLNSQFDYVMDYKSGSRDDLAIFFIKIE